MGLSHLSQAPLKKPSNQLETPLLWEADAFLTKIRGTMILGQATFPVHGLTASFAPSSFRAMGPQLSSLHIPASVPDATAAPAKPAVSSGAPAAEAESDSPDEAGTLPRNCRVIIRGNQRTKPGLLGKAGWIKRAVGLGGWHLVVLNGTGEEIRIQRNALVSASVSDRCQPLSYSSGCMRVSGLHHKPRALTSC